MKFFILFAHEFSAFMLLLLSPKTSLKTRNRLGYSSLLRTFLTIKSNRLKYRKLMCKEYIFLFFQLNLALAWNAQGHILVADAALQELSAAQVAKLENYNKAFNLGYKPKSLQQAAVWLDWIHCRQIICKNFKYYHYVDYPYSDDRSRVNAPYKVNAITAVEQAMYILQNPRYSAYEKGLQLRILMHVVADLHQPMHTISLFNARFPHGDRGGNDYLLGNNRVGKNLHAYWDRGGGYLRKKSFKKPKAGKTLVKECEDLDPRIWARESYNIAKDFAYSIKYRHKPTKPYQRMVSKITKQRLSLAS